MTKPRVKPLVWEERWSGGDEDIPSWRAKNPLGLFVGFSFAGRLLNGRHIEKHSDAPPEWVAEAKAAAQADYEARILSALDLTPDPAVQSLVEAARLLHDNVVTAFPSLADLGPVSNLRAALAAFDKTD